MGDATENKLVGVTLPTAWYDRIVTQLKPLENVQDFIRDAISEKLEHMEGKV